jgi:small nuclear ribonucleoprotein (snRNP)-like protein
MTGCKSTYQLTNCSEIEQEIYGESVIIKMTNGETYEGKLIETGLDSLTFVHSSSKKEFMVPSSAIKKIIYKRSGKGALDGFLYGYLTGAGIGVIYFSVGHPNFWGILLLSAVFGVPSGLIGVPVGAVIGHTDEYIFEVPSDSTSTNIKNKEIKGINLNQ